MKYIITIVFIMMITVPVSAKEWGRKNYDLGIFFLEKGNYESALHNFQKALKLNPDNPLYLHQLGKTYIQLKKYSKALSNLEEALYQSYEYPVPKAFLWEIKHDIAYTFFLQKKYTKASKMFISISKQDPSNILTKYYAGVSLFECGYYKQALPYLLDITNQKLAISGEASYYAGICLQKAGQKKEAIEKMVYAKKHAVEQNLVNNSEQQLNQIYRKKSSTINAFNASLKIGYLYKNMVVLDAVHDDKMRDETDFALECFASVNRKFFLTDQMSFIAGFNQYQLWHNDNKDFDISGSIINASTVFQQGLYTLCFNYLPTWYQVADKKYLMIHQLKSQLIRRMNTNIKIKLSYNYNSNNHYQNNDKDGHSQGLNVMTIYKDDQKKLFGCVSVINEKNAHPDYNFLRLDFYSGFSINTLKNIELSLSGKYTIKNFENISYIDSQKRKDSKYIASVSFSRKYLSGKCTATLKYDYANNDSNFSQYEYLKKDVVFSIRINI